jgi:UDP-N-acetylglucosamine--N-acetylmuramyl-(pentapeptide) pyrophosphoryl-undecaprenol N-acetylglucosamine transferase
MVEEHPRIYLGLTLLPYVKAELPDLVKLSDIVISRAGATALAELAAVGVAVVVAPSPYLASDHQTKNAELFQVKQAAVMVSETELKSGDLVEILIDLINGPAKREKLAANLAKFRIKNSAAKTAKIIIGVGNERLKKV